MPIDEIYKAVLAVDESKLSEPHIKTLQMCAPERLEVCYIFIIFVTLFLVLAIKALNSCYQ